MFSRNIATQAWRAYSTGTDGNQRPTDPFLVKLWVCSKAKYSSLVSDNTAAKQVQCPGVVELRNLFHRTELYLRIADMMHLSSGETPSARINATADRVWIADINAVLPGTGKRYRLISTIISSWSFLLSHILLLLPPLQPFMC